MSQRSLSPSSHVVGGEALCRYREQTTNEDNYFEDNNKVDDYSDNENNLDNSTTMATRTEVGQTSRTKFASPERKNISGDDELLRKPLHGGRKIPIKNTSFTAEGIPSTISHAYDRVNFKHDPMQGDKLSSDFNIKSNEKTKLPSPERKQVADVDELSKQHLHGGERLSRIDTSPSGSNRKFVEMTSTKIEKKSFTKAVQAGPNKSYSYFEKVTVEHGTVQGNRFSYIIIPVIVVVLGVGLGVCLLGTSRGNSGNVKNNQSQQTRDITATMFAASWLNLKRNFPNQEPKFWTITGAATSSAIVDKHPKDPAVIILVVPKTADPSTSKCFINQYASVITNLHKQQEVDVVSFKSQLHTNTKPSQVKLKIDHDLQEGFDSGQKIAVIEHLELLPGEAATMFYKFCENDNAPFKRVVILFTLHIEDDEEFEAKRGIDEFVVKKLAEVWEHKIGADTFRPLLSRIANSVALLNPETEETLSRIGC